MSKEKQNFIDRLVGKGTLQQRIMKTILICVLLPMAILSVVSILQVAPLTSDIGTQGTNAVNQEGIDALQSSVTDAARWVKIELDQAKADLQRLAQTELSILSIYPGSMNVTENRISYRAGSPPPLSASSKYGTSISTRFSDWACPFSLTDQINDTVNRSAYLDYSMIGIANNTMSYMRVFQVFQNGVSRVYPYIPGRSGTQNLLAESWYTSTVNQPNGTMVVSPAHTTTIGSLTYPAIYVSMPLKNASTPLGCIAIEYRLTSLRTYLNGVAIQTTGYVALLDNNKNALSHKSLTETTASTSMVTLEGISTTEFTNLLNLAVSGTNSTGAFMKSGMEMRAAYATVGAGNLYIIAFVPYNEIVSPSVQLQSDLANLNMIAILIFMGAAVAIFIVVYFIVIKVSRSITRPVVTLTAAIENMTKGDLTSEIPMDAKSRGDELGTLAMSFQNLLTTMRLGNKSYYRGDLTLAYTKSRFLIDFWIDQEPKT